MKTKKVTITRNTSRMEGEFSCPLPSAVLLILNYPAIA